MLDFFDQKTCLLVVVGGLEMADQFALADIGPQVLAESTFVVADHRVGGIEDDRHRSVIAGQLDRRGDAQFFHQQAHVADIGATEGVDRLIVVADREERAVLALEQLQPEILQPAGVLEFIDQDVAETLLVVLAQHRVAAQQFVGAQQQFGEIDGALAVQLAIVFGVILDQMPAERIPGLDLVGTQAGFLVLVDEALHLARVVLFGIDIEPAQHALDGGKLV